ncbi:MAG: hypothetical protein VB934_21100, partial [Polyangiaceae bacterium]
MDLDDSCVVRAALVGSLLVALVAGGAGLTGCGDDPIQGAGGAVQGAGGAGGTQGQGGSPTPAALERYCGDRNWEETLIPASLGYSGGEPWKQLEQALKISEGSCVPDTMFPD